jgi:hypothetical protein
LKFSPFKFKLPIWKDWVGLVFSGLSWPVRVRMSPMPVPPCLFHPYLGVAVLFCLWTFTLDYPVIHCFVSFALYHRSYFSCLHLIFQFKLQNVGVWVEKSEKWLKFDWLCYIRPKVR